MRTLWAPWRMEYIRSEKAGGCIFCEKVGEDRDAENLILFRGRYHFIIMNAYPYNNGHLMIAPYAHVAALEDLPPETRHEMMDLAARCARALKASFHPDALNAGFNLGAAAGAGIADHMHMHVVPRWNGDTNFMPVLGEVRVISEALNSTWKRLKETWPK